jgi:hypothetical protein
MVRHLSAATTALQQGNSDQVQPNIDRATRLFNQEQRLFRRTVETGIVGAGGTLVTRINASGLLTRDQLRTAETRDGVSAGTYYRTSNGLHNGREDLAAAVQRRVTRGRELLRREMLSYHEVASLYQSFTADDQAISRLMALWSGPTVTRITALDQAQRVEAYDLYTEAAMVISDPQFNPWSSWSQERQRAAARLQLRLRGNTTPSDAQVRQAARDIVPALMHSVQFRYDDAIYGVYRAVSQAAARRPSLRSRPFWRASGRWSASTSPSSSAATTSSSAPSPT